MKIFRDDLLVLFGKNLCVQGIIESLVYLGVFESRIVGKIALAAEVFVALLAQLEVEDIFVGMVELGALRTQEGLVLDLKDYHRIGMRDQAVGKVKFLRVIEEDLVLIVYLVVFVTQDNGQLR